MQVSPALANRRWRSDDGLPTEIRLRCFSPCAQVCATVSSAGVAPARGESSRCEHSQAHVLVTGDVDAPLARGRLSQVLGQPRSVEICGCGPRGLLVRLLFGALLCLWALMSLVQELWSPDSRDSWTGASSTLLACLRQIGMSWLQREPNLLLPSCSRHTTHPHRKSCLFLFCRD